MTQLPPLPDIMKRLDDVEQRLTQYASAAAPNGLTQPDPGGTERWVAPQVWAHIAEFVPYWQAEMEKVVGTFGGTPVPFGRTKEDPTRIGAIEAGRGLNVPSVLDEIRTAIQITRSYLSNMTPEQWQALGEHSIRGAMTVPQMLERFTVGHLEEHADQLEALV